MSNHATARDPLGPVLVVDDDPLIGQIIAAQLEPAGYRVLAMADAETALGYLEGGLRPSLIILDLCMPGMAGYAFRTALFATPRFAEIPIAVLSACADTIDTPLRLGVVAVLQKPADTQTLLDLVEQHCHRPPVPASAGSRGASAARGRHRRWPLDRSRR